MATSQDENSLSQEVKIALMQHYTSQMQGYKTTVLTLFVGFFAGVESLRIFQLPPPLVLYLFSLGSGLLLGGIFYCAARFGWYGKLVWHCLNPQPPFTTPSAGAKLPYEWSQIAAESARHEWNREGFIRANWQRLAKLGDTARTLELTCWAAVVGLASAIAVNLIALLALAIQSWILA